ncbi:unnamed protein product [Arctogadus glacialis]
MRGGGSTMGLLLGLKTLIDVLPECLVWFYQNISSLLVLPERLVWFYQNISSLLVLPERLVWFYQNISSLLVLPERLVWFYQNISSLLVLPERLVWFYQNISSLLVYSLKKQVLQVLQISQSPASLHPWPPGLGPLAPWVGAWGCPLGMTRDITPAEAASSPPETTHRLSPRPARPVPPAVMKPHAATRLLTKPPFCQREHGNSDVVVSSPCLPPRANVSPLEHMSPPWSTCLPQGPMSPPRS